MAMGMAIHVCSSNGIAVHRRRAGHSLAQRKVTETFRRYCRLQIRSRWAAHLQIFKHSHERLRLRRQKPYRRGEFCRGGCGEVRPRAKSRRATGNAALLRDELLRAGWASVLLEHAEPSEG